MGPVPDPEVLSPDSAGPSPAPEALVYPEAWSNIGMAGRGIVIPPPRTASLANNLADLLIRRIDFDNILFCVATTSPPKT